MNRKLGLAGIAYIDLLAGGNEADWVEELNTRSFTYGDSMPNFSPKVNDRKECRY